MDFNSPRYNSKMVLRINRHDWDFILIPHGTIQGLGAYVVGIVKEVFQFPTVQLKAVMMLVVYIEVFNFNSPRYNSRGPYTSTWPVFKVNFNSPRYNSRRRSTQTPKTSTTISIPHGTIQSYRIDLTTSLQGNFNSPRYNSKLVAYLRISRRR